MLDATGKKSKDVTLAAEVFGVDVKPHLIYETVRAEAAGAHALGRPAPRSGPAAVSPSPLSRGATSSR
jgi:ribosomal protein L4